jgi:hypothetical protein
MFGSSFEGGIVMKLYDIRNTNGSEKRSDWTVVARDLTAQQVLNFIRDHADDYYFSTMAKLMFVSNATITVEQFEQDIVPSINNGEFMQGMFVNHVGYLEG